LVNDVIANNTFYAPFTGSGGANLYLDGSASYSNTIIENNIFDSAGSEDVEIYTTSGQLSGKVTFKTNAWYGGTNAPGLASGTGDILTNQSWLMHQTFLSASSCKMGRLLLTPAQLSQQSLQTSLIRARHRARLMTSKLLNVLHNRNLEECGACSEWCCILPRLNADREDAGSVS
jgi:hypothetical protein